MKIEDLKKAAAEAAIAYIEPKLNPDSIVGVGTGSTTNYFIDALGAIRHKFDAAVSSSEGSTARLENLGVRVINLNAAPRVSVYVDGADEVEPGKALIKGGGGALTREKIIAAASEEFVCVVDSTKSWINWVLSPFRWKYYQWPEALLPDPSLSLVAILPTEIVSSPTMAT